MASDWPALPYEQWRDTCDTLHGHAQVLGKLAAALAPPEPELQHAALRLGARGWETLPLPDFLFWLYPLLSPVEWVVFRLRQRRPMPAEEQGLEG